MATLGGSQLFTEYRAYQQIYRTLCFRKQPNPVLPLYSGSLADKLGKVFHLKRLGDEMARA